MRMLGCVFLFLLFVSLGVYASNQLEKRIKQLKSLEKAIESMKREIDYRVSPLCETLLKTAKRTEHPWCLFLEEAGRTFQNRKEGILNPDEIFQKGIRRIQLYHPWEKDLNVILNLGRSLGELDKKMQIMELSMAEEEVRELIQEAREEKRTKGKLYQTLGVCMGILSVILVL